VTLNKGRRWIFGARGVQFWRGFEGRKSPSGAQGKNPWRSVAKPPEAEGTLPIADVGKVFYASQLVPKR